MFTLAKVMVDTAEYYSCGGLDVQISGQIINIVHLIYLFIQIAVPIVLVIFGMMDLFKAVIAQKEDEIKKGQQMFIKRLIAAIIVFLVFALVNVVISLVSNDESVTGCGRCFIQGTVEKGSCVKK